MSVSSASPPGSQHEGDQESIPEEYKAILESIGNGQEEYEEPKPKGCSFFDYEEMIKPTLDEYHVEHLKDTSLFSNVVTFDQENELTYKEKPDSSILVTGFGMRNLRSFQNALETTSSEKKAMYELYTSVSKSQSEAGKEGSSASLLAEKPTKDQRVKITTETETDMSTVSSGISVQQEKLIYLMGLDADTWEEEAYPREEELVKEMLEKESDDFVFSPASTTFLAQKYLRTHRIFDFFQFIITHLLSAAPENPITFILVLLNKILLYRAGTGNPPLLYDQHHIEQLFRLMDRMDSGYIDMKQYESGMKTLGICEFNKQPTLSADGLVSKKVFVREALESETALFNDLIKRKWIGSKPPKGSFSDMTCPVRNYESGTYFIPSDLMLKTKHMPSAAEMEENEACEDAV